MNAILTRYPSTVQGTPGEIVAVNALGRELRLQSIELPWLDNRVSVSCIPTGTYRCEWRQSPSQGWCYHVLDVPGRSHILIHKGNWAGDRAKGWHSDVQGCILPGMSTAYGTPKGFRKAQRMVCRSAVACANLRNHMGMEPFTLEIR